MAHDQEFLDCGEHAVFKSLRLENFKCYGGPTGDIPLRPLTIIVGPNNAGKSTLIHAMLLVKQTLEDPSRGALVTTGDFVDVGGFYDILYGGQKALSQTFSIGLTRDEEDQAAFPDKCPRGSGPHRLADSVDVEFRFDADSTEIRVASCQLQCGGNTVFRSHNGEKEWEASGVGGAAKKRLELLFVNFFPSLWPKKSTKTLTGLSKARRIAEQLESQRWRWERLARSLHHVPPVRSRLPWYSRIGQRTTIEPGVAGENLLHRFASAELISGTGKPLLSLVDDWVSQRFQMLACLRLESLDKAKRVRSLVGDEVKGQRGINLAAMGEGLAQLLPIVVEAVSAGRKGCLLVEQPELHLHPRAQSDLADLFIDNVAPGRQFIIETHSEHLLLRLRRRIAEGKIKPENVSILYIEKIDGRSHVTPLRLNGDGYFQQWPEGFFDEAYQEAMALSRVANGKAENGHH